MKRLYFLRPEFHDGLNLTVRNGTKWLDVYFGEEVMLAETGTDREFGTAHIVAVREVEFAHLKTWYDEGFLRFEHDPASRTLEGLARALDHAYGLDAWDPQCLTALLFVPRRAP